jgi:bifunctional DNase/RNase
MKLVGVRVEMPSNTPIVLLQENDGDARMLPIFIGQAEATAIALALEDVDTPRPMTHDLVRDLLMVLGATLDKVVVTDLRDKTFYAELHLTVGDKTEVVSCRPSDALAIAVRTDAEIYAETHVVDSAGFIPEPDEVDDEEEDGEGVEEVLDEFREFIDNINPEDFGG